MDSRLSLELILRPYRPRPDWMGYMELAFGVAVLLFLIVAAVGGTVGYFRNKKREKHAALERVLARKKKSQ